MKDLDSVRGCTNTFLPTALFCLLLRTDQTSPKTFQMLCPLQWLDHLRAGTRVHEPLGTVEDQMSVWHHILLCLPQNNQIKNCFYRDLSWPQISCIADG
ncbi:hypothetical protein U0070_004146 [Myodes glareolus]|uniref:Secreted protein n=1 Tax=Myodes glareolus TaxID=447135 RepID=A0AAW0KBG7_MYOGA